VVDFERAHNFPLPLLPDSAPKGIVITDSHSFNLALYFIACVSWSLQNWHHYSETREALAFDLSVSAQKLIASEFMQLLPSTTGQPQSILQTVTGRNYYNQLTALCKAGVINTFSCNESFNHVVIKDEIGEVEFSTESSYLFEPLLAVIWYRVNALFNDQKFCRIADWLHIFGNPLDDIYVITSKKNIEDTVDQREVSFAAKREHEPYIYRFPQLEKVKGLAVPNCSCGLKPKVEVYIDEADDGHSIRIECLACEGKEVQGKGSRLNVHKALIAWIDMNPEKFSIKDSAIHQLSVMVDDGLSLKQIYETMSLFLRSIKEQAKYEAMVEKYRNVPTTFTKTHKIRPTSFAAFENTQINKEWAECIQRVIMHRLTNS
jgi:hypothetical protein